jgi:hypothetical protein
MENPEPTRAVLLRLSDEARYVVEKLLVFEPKSEFLRIDTEDPVHRAPKIVRTPFNFVLIATENPDPILCLLLRDTEEPSAIIPKLEAFFPTANQEYTEDRCAGVPTDRIDNEEPKNTESTRDYEEPNLPKFRIDALEAKT